MKLRVAVLFGGQSTEHEVSVHSATAIAQALDPARYDVVLVGIDHDGSWSFAEPDAGLLPEAVFGHGSAVRAFPTPANGFDLRAPGSGESILGAPIDVVFPIVHGRSGEDGELQGLLELSRVAYVGCGVLSSALCMDKVASKRILRDAGIPVLPWLDATRHEVRDQCAALLDRVAATFSFPVFIKPANTGSSVGIRRATNRDELRQALEEAAGYDLHVLVEPALDAREVECAVLGGHLPKASVAGEIVYEGGFYDYEAKYVSEATELVIPARLDEDTEAQVRELAERAFRALFCWGMARVDFFLGRDTGQLVVNELNTLPGFTEGSLYPRAWEVTGIPMPELCDQLIEHALERARARAETVTRYRS